ncbi:MAG: hypothetical protein KAS78_01650 [Candidatus Pacebacteria bacterium]|nr:hypothetical protein [Candidatus Paceibacterota bacterium]
MANNKENWQSEKDPLLQDNIEFKGKDCLSNESADEFYEIVKHWNEFSDPVKQLDGWCNYYYERKHVPINFAFKLWENESCRDEAWPYVKEEFQDYQDILDKHGATPEIIEDIKKRLETSKK